MWTPTASTPGMSLFKDFRGQLSWGRICSLVALVVAVKDHRSTDVAHLAIWLGVATGSYGLSKVTEMITSKSIGLTGLVGGAGIDSPGKCPDVATVPRPDPITNQESQ